MVRNRMTRMWILPLFLLFVNSLCAQDYFSPSEFALIEFDPISQEPVWPLTEATTIPDFRSGRYQVAPVAPDQIVDQVTIEADNSSYKISYCGGIWNAWAFAYEENAYILCVTLEKWPHLKFIVEKLYYFWRHSENEEMTYFVLWEKSPAYAYYLATIQADGNFSLRPISRKNLKSIIPPVQYDEMMESYFNLLSVTPQLASEMRAKMTELAQSGKQYTFTLVGPKE